MAAFLEKHKLSKDYASYKEMCIRDSMKRVLLFFSLMLIIGTSNVSSKMPVKDKGKWSVLNNMEFMDRVRLQPEWYHYWIWYKKVLGIKIPLPKSLKCRQF